MAYGEQCEQQRNRSLNSGEIIFHVDETTTGNLAYVAYTYRKFNANSLNVLVSHGIIY